MPAMLSKGPSTCAAGSVVRNTPIEYPVPWIVRHTFVDIPMQRSPSIEDFYSPREVQSAPGSNIDGFSALAVPDMLPTLPATQGPNPQDAPIILRLADALDLELQNFYPNSGVVESQGNVDGKHEPLVCYPKRGSRRYAKRQRENKKQI